MPRHRTFHAFLALLMGCFAPGMVAHAQQVTNICFAVADGGYRGGLQDKLAEDVLTLIDKTTGVESNV